MLSNFAQPILAQRLRLIGCATLAIALSACGGGGGDPGATGPTTGTGTGTGTGTTATPKVALTLVDGTGATVSTLAGGQTGVVRAKVTDAKGALVPNAVVKFTADGDLVDFVPESGSALTDANGVAVINIKPKSLTAAGALTVKAESVVAGLTGSSTINLAVGASPLTVGELSWTPAPSGKLPAFSTAALSIPVTAGGQPATSVTGLNLTSLCVGDGLATIVPGPLANGVQSATYTNNGCLRGTDTITASIGNSSKTINLAVDAASIGTIQFVSTDLAGSAIVLRGSGGLGRKESALLTYRVLDQNNKGLAGVDVSFRATTNTGGLTVQPDKGTTDANGQVTTTVSSGTIPTPVRVVAEATRNGKVISGLSDTLVISTGLPIQRSMSLSADAYNIEGWNIDGTVAKVTVRMADQYGNPISDNTAVNFVTEGGAVGSSLQGACTTTDGGCTVELRSQNFRPTNGRVTVMAYVQGVEDFVDSNGDGQYSCTTWVDPNGKATTTYRPLIDTCVAGGEPFTDMGDPYLDTGSHGSTKGLQEQKIFGTLDNSYDAGLGDQPIPYNSNSYRATGNGKWGINYIRRSAEFTFSGTTPYFVRVKCDSEGANCVDWNAATDGDAWLINGLLGSSCDVQTLYFRIFDVNNNPAPAGTRLDTVDADKLAPLTISPNVVPSTADIGGTIHRVNIKPDSACGKGSFAIKMTVPSGAVFATKSFRNY